MVTHTPRKQFYNFKHAKHIKRANHAIFMMHTKTWARKARQTRDQAKHDMHENHTSMQARHLADPKQINYV